MSAADYHGPVAQLLTAPSPLDVRAWPDYLTRHALTREHIPQLIQMLMDLDLHNAPLNEHPGWVSAPIHAWRSLGQLQASEAVESLMMVLRGKFETDDWVREEVPLVLGMIGMDAGAAITDLLYDSGADEWLRVSVTRAFEKLAQSHPEARDACVTALVQQLERKENVPELNAFITSALLTLNAKEALPAVEAAYAAGVVEESICGDVDRVRERFDLNEPLPSEVLEEALGFSHRADPLAADDGNDDDLDDEDEDDDEKSSLPVKGAPGVRKPISSSARDKKKAKRKQEQKSRKTNRKK
jgi:hypothetical protein